MEEEFAMRQGYISVRPTVRIREEALAGGKTDYVLCFKSEGGLAREEIERSIDKELFDDLEHKIIAKPLIPRRAALPPAGRFVLEVNHVDAGQPTAFWYARWSTPRGGSPAWQPDACGLGDYLHRKSRTSPARAWAHTGADTRTLIKSKRTRKWKLQYNSPVILTFFCCHFWCCSSTSGRMVDDDASVLCLPLLAEGPAVLHPAVRPCSGPCQLGPLSE